jgi:hypothetical protein
MPRNCADPAFGGAGVSPAIFLTLADRKNAGGTPALQLHVRFIAAHHRPHFLKCSFAKYFLQCIFFSFRSSGISS